MYNDGVVPGQFNDMRIISTQFIDVFRSHSTLLALQANNSLEFLRAFQCTGAVS